MATRPSRWCRSQKPTPEYSAGARTLSTYIELGVVSEEVTVRANAPMLHSQASGLRQVIDDRKVVDLALNSRSFIALVPLAPGVAMPPAPAAPLPRINGGRSRTNEYLFDGISVLQPEPGQVAFFPNVDAIQEFRIRNDSEAAAVSHTGVRAESGGVQRDQHPATAGPEHGRG